MTPDQFKEWFASSRAVDEAGRPVVAFQTGGNNVEDAGLLVFGASPVQVEGVHWLAPAYLRIERPLVDSPDDPFIDLALIADSLGGEQAWRIARKFCAAVQTASTWSNGLADHYGGDFARFLAEANEDHLRGLCVEAAVLLNDAVEVDLLSAAGFDGAIVGGSGQYAGGPEYRVFSANQVLPAIEARWPSPRTWEDREVLSLRSVSLESRTQSVGRVRAAIERVVGEAGVRLGEGLGRLVITTSADLNLAGQFQLRPGVLASYAADPGFRAMLAEQREAKRRTLEAIGEVLDAAVLKHASGADRWQMVLPDVAGNGRWRTQSFDLNGFSGHMVFDDKAGALDSAVGLGFTSRDDSALDRVQNLPSFQRGLFAADLLMQVNAGQLQYEEADRKLAQYDECARVLCSIAERHAQAFVTADGETICLLADRIQPGQEQAVFLHEITHRHGRTILGPDGWSRQVRTIKGWNHWPQGSLEREIFIAASARAQEACGDHPGLYEEELFAYAVEEAVARGVVPSAQAYAETAPQWLDAVTGALRGVLAEALGKPLEKDPSPQQCVDLAYALAQLDTPDQLQRILDALSHEERVQLRGLSARGGRPGWFSALERRIESRGAPQMRAAHWQAWLTRQIESGIKPDEIHWSGVLDWLGTLDPAASVARAQVLGYLRANGVVVGEKLIGAGSVLDGERKRAQAIVDLTAEGWTPIRSADGQRITGFTRRSDGRLFAPFGEDGRVFYASVDTRERVSAQINAMMQVAGWKPGESTSIDTSAQYADYTLSGGSNYRELLLKLEPVLEYQVLLDEFDAAVERERHARRPRDLQAESLVEFDARWAKLPELAAQRKQAFQRLGAYENARPQRPSFNSGHWQTPNVIAHVRLTDRLCAQGRRVLFIEEIQSDWAQAGKRDGFRMTPWELRSLEQGSPAAIAALASGRAGDMRVEVRTGFGQETAGLRLSPPAGNELVSPAPFVTSTDKWVGLVLKRVIRMAVEEGYDSVAITSGEQQVQRYRLERRFEAVEFKIAENETQGTLEAYDHSGHCVLCALCSIGEVSAWVGAKNAEVLFEGRTTGYVGDNRKVYVATGLDVTIGGEGMRKFYDEIVPLAMRNTIKSLGGDGLRVLDLGDGDVPSRVDSSSAVQGKGGAATQLGFDVTPEMRNFVKGGIALFGFAADDDAGRRIPRAQRSPA